MFIPDTIPARAGRKDVKTMYNTDDLKKLSKDALAALENYKSSDGTYIIPVQWTMSAYITVKADNLKDAITAVLDDPDIPLPENNTEYVDDTFEIAIDEDEDAFSTINKQDGDLPGLLVSEVILDKNDH